MPGQNWGGEQSPPFFLRFGRTSRLPLNCRKTCPQSQIEMKFQYLLLASLFVVPSLSLGDPIDDCRAKFGSDASAHITCLETAINELQGITDEHSSLPSATAVPDEPKVAPVIAAGSVEASAPAATAGTAAPGAAASSEATGLGAEQVRENSPSANDEVQQVTVQIVSTSYNSKGLGTFRMLDGQVWRETTASPQRKRLDTGKQYTARIERSKIGGYRMYVDGVRWMKTVERLE